MRMFFFVSILVGIIIMFTAGGIELPISGGLVRTMNLMGGSSGQNATLNLSEVKSSALWSNDSATDSIPGLTYIFLGLAAAGLIIGIFGRAPDVSYIKAGLVFIFSGLLLTDLIAIWIKLNSYGISWLSWGSFGILGVLTAGFFVTIIDWWTGSD